MIEERGRYGWLFEVRIPSSEDVIIDEDQLGEMAVEGSVKWFTAEARRLASQEEYLGQDEDMVQCYGNLWDAAKDGEYCAWIQLGHLLIAHMTDDNMRALLPKATQLAVTGKLPVIKAWRVDKLRSEEMFEKQPLRALEPI